MTTVDTYPELVTALRRVLAQDNGDLLVRAALVEAHLADDWLRFDRAQMAEVTASVPAGVEGVAVGGRTGGGS